MKPRAISRVGAGGLRAQAEISLLPMRQLTLAVLQLALSRADEADNIAAVSVLVEQAAARGAHLVLAPELFSGEYFCREEDERLFDLARPTAEHPSVAAMQKLAKALKVSIPTSFFERDGHHYYNTLAMIDADGEIAGTYRKSHIPDGPGYEEKYYFRPGNDGFKVWDVPCDGGLAKVGVGICWDQWYPEAARLMAMAGAEMLIYPTAIGYESTDSDYEKKRQFDAWQTVQRGHAIANGLPVITVNRIGHEPDWSGVTEGIEFWGQSFVAGPQGELLYSASDKKEEATVIEIDKERTENVRRIWPFFRDRRIEAYRDLTKRFID